MKKKTIALLLVMMMVFGITVGGTIAYLTDTTDVVKNTFTVGNVQIKLDETDVDLYGVKDGETRVTANTYKMIPGHTYTKDPTVTVEEGSEDAYVRMIVTLKFNKALTDEEVATALDNIFTGHDATKWTRKAKTVSEDKKTIEYEYRYADALTAGKSESLFTGFTIPGTMDVKALGGFTMDVVAHAIQKDGFTSVDNAFDTGWGK